MPRITFVQPDGRSETLEVPCGHSAMDAARAHNIRGLRGECGGECLCSTCHCYVDMQWLARLPGAEHREAQLIEFAWQPKTASRLACQLRVTEALDGLVLHVPERQL